jgi:hypothetical protein
MNTELTNEEYNAIKRKNFQRISSEPKYIHSFIKFQDDEANNLNYVFHLHAQGNCMVKYSGKVENNSINNLEKTVGIILIRFPETIKEIKPIQLYTKDEKFVPYIDLLINKYKS